MILYLYLPTYLHALNVSFALARQLLVSGATRAKWWVVKVTKEGPCIRHLQCR